MIFNIQSLIIDRFVAELKADYKQTYNMMEPQYAHIIEWCGRLALENIANSDALYHNLDHTILVTMVGQAILKGKHLAEGGVTPQDWLHFTTALLFHDIGYVRGVCRGDKTGHYATGSNGSTIHLPQDQTDASLTPYHVDRGKLFVQERLGNTLQGIVDVARIQEYIEMTRFPVPDDPWYADTRGFRGLVRAADFIGQLGDPNYLRKIPALFYEFHETGENENTGYQSPGHMRQNFTRFYWQVVRPHIQDALIYLQKTQEGKQWIANLYSHVFAVEHQVYDLVG
jgi:hypothetical protein